MRTRDLKPDFWTDEKVVQVSDGAKLLFQGLWNLADREGRLEDKPVSIGFKVRPWDPGAVPVLLEELAAIGLIVRYEAAGLKCIDVPNLPAHQRMHPREMASKLPPRPGKGAASREKVSLSPASQVIAPGSAGPSGPSGSAGPSGPSGPPPPAPPKLVVVGKSRRSLHVDDLSPLARARWEKLQATRVVAGLTRETAPPDAFPRWSDQVDLDGLEEGQVEHAHVMYLRDADFERRQWPTAVFITPGVFRQRVPERHEVAQ